ncbi:PT repeat protein, partial [Toxoplasma gondii p89]
MEDNELLSILKAGCPFFLAERRSRESVTDEAQLDPTNSVNTCWVKLHPSEEYLQIGCVPSIEWNEEQTEFVDMNETIPLKDVVEVVPNVDGEANFHSLTIFTKHEEPKEVLRLSSLQYRRDEAIDNIINALQNGGVGSKTARDEIVDEEVRALKEEIRESMWQWEMPNKHFERLMALVELLNAKLRHFLRKKDYLLQEFQHESRGYTNADCPLFPGTHEANTHDSRGRGTTCRRPVGASQATLTDALCGRLLEDEEGDTFYGMGSAYRRSRSWNESISSFHSSTYYSDIPGEDDEYSLFGRRYCRTHDKCAGPHRPANKSDYVCRNHDLRWDNLDDGCLGERNRHGGDCCRVDCNSGNSSRPTKDRQETSLPSEADVRQKVPLPRRPRHHHHHHHHHRHRHHTRPDGSPGGCSREGTRKTHTCSRHYKNNEPLQVREHLEDRPRVPSREPSLQSSRQPSRQPSRQHSGQPNREQSRQHSETQSRQPSRQTSRVPSCQPSRSPSCQPSRSPSCQPSRSPSCQPSHSPSRQPSRSPSRQPSRSPSRQLSRQPSPQKSHKHSHQPRGQRSRESSRSSSRQPSRQKTPEGPIAQCSMTLGHQRSCEHRDTFGAPDPCGESSNRNSTGDSRQVSLQESRVFSNPDVRENLPVSCIPTAHVSRAPSDQHGTSVASKHHHPAPAKPGTLLDPTYKPGSRMPSRAGSCVTSRTPSRQQSRNATPVASPTVRSPSRSVQSSRQPSRQASRHSSDGANSNSMVDLSGQPTCQPFGELNLGTSRQASRELSRPPSRQVNHACGSRQPSQQLGTEPGHQSLYEEGARYESNYNLSQSHSQVDGSGPDGILRDSRLPSRNLSHQTNLEERGQVSQHPSRQQSRQPSRQRSREPSRKPSRQISRAASGPLCQQPSREPSRQITNQLSYRRTASTAPVEEHDPRRHASRQISSNRQYEP